MCFGFVVFFVFMYELFDIPFLDIKELGTRRAERSELLGCSTLRKAVEKQEIVCGLYLRGTESIAGELAVWRIE